MIAYVIKSNFLAIKLFEKETLLYTISYLLKVKPLYINPCHAE